jgi:hypothetical protein
VDLSQAVPVHAPDDPQSMSLQHTLPAQLLHGAANSISQCIHEERGGSTISPFEPPHYLVKESLVGGNLWHHLRGGKRRAVLIAGRTLRSGSSHRIPRKGQQN